MQPFCRTQGNASIAQERANFQTERDVKLRAAALGAEGRAGSIACVRHSCASCSRPTRSMQQLQRAPSRGLAGYEAETERPAALEAASSSISDAGYAWSILAPIIGGSGASTIHGAFTCWSCSETSGLFSWSGTALLTEVRGRDKKWYDTTGIGSSRN